ncbi:MAG: biotin--[acetyl-CoA-carboxylase] ligase [Candidatus Omnitrophica bacterium]|nr:biotin--[acetyl-CoA-carboxylase] ligase [Candidatus Omnitrophota bacterium]
MQSHIIQYLKFAPGFVSGEDISRELHMSRTAVWKHIEELRASGYEIEAVPHHGYRLVGIPDRLSSLEVQYRLGTKKFGGYLYHFNTIDSTMNEAFRLGTEGAAEGTVVVAETQTKGRGRMGRTWSSPKARGIYFSIILRPSCAPSAVSGLTLLAAVAVSEAMEKVSGLKALIKWPNDLLLEGKKVCGILTELRAETDRVSFVCLGVGINVNNTFSQLLPEATSLRIEKKEMVSRVELLQEILRSLERRYRAALKSGFSSVLNDWKARSATLNRKVRFTERGVSFEGTAFDVDSDGALLVRLEGGKVMKRVSGDILL